MTDNELIATKVMEYHSQWEDCWQDKNNKFVRNFDPSKKIDQAVEALEKYCGDYDCDWSLVRIRKPPQKYMCSILNPEKEIDKFGPALCTAICAALREAVGG